MGRQDCLRVYKLENKKIVAWGTRSNETSGALCVCMAKLVQPALHLRKFIAMGIGGLVAAYLGHLYWFLVVTTFCPLSG